MLERKISMDMNTVASVNTRMLENLNSVNRQTGSELDQDDFLKLLVAQLANQDPMEPTSNTEFLSQLAQFSLLAQMQSLNSGFLTSQAYSLIGKTVTIEDPDTSEVISGRVDGVVREDGIDYLIIGEEKYEVSWVTGVMEASPGEAEA